MTSNCRCAACAREATPPPPRWQAARDAYQDRDEARADVDLLVEALRDVQDAHAQCCASLALARGRRA